MAKPWPPSNSNPHGVLVGANAPATSQVDPRASVIERDKNKLYPWSTSDNGWLNFDNTGCLSAAEKLEMLCDPQVAAMVHLRRSWVLMDGVQIKPTEGVEPMSKPRQINRKYERAVIAAEMCRWMLCNTEDSFHGALMELQHADWWRNQACELVWRDQSWGEYSGKLMLDRMPVYGPQDYMIWRKDGRIIGLESRHEWQRDPSKPKVYPIEKFALHRFRPSRRNVFGDELAKIANLPHWMKKEGQPQRMMNLFQFGSPYTYAIAPENSVSEVPLLDANDVQMTYPVGHARAGEPIYVPPARALKETLGESLGNGGFGVLPGTSKVGLLQAQGNGTIFSEFDRDMNWELAVAILGTGTLTQEQNYGSNATAKTGKDTVNTPILSDKTALAEVIKKSFCQPAVRYNLPFLYWDVVPTVTCGDPGKDVWATLLTTLMNAMPTEMAIEIGGELARRNGLTDLDFVRLRELADSGELPIGTVPNSNGAQVSTQN